MLRTIFSTEMMRKGTRGKVYFIYITHSILKVVKTSQELKIVNLAVNLC